MKFQELSLPGAYVLELDPVEDERGFFARAFCEQELAERGIGFRIVQCNVSYNRRKGTLRGLHYQTTPHEEAKLVRCFSGSVYDVIVDLRKSSPTYRGWAGVELTSRNRRMIYVPPGFGHGLQTLEDDTELFYLMSECYHPESARTVRWDDPQIAVAWPLANPFVGENDSAALLLDEQQ
jgi:dTDP-4-dehydrorhamnose 3,5-epimerase